MNCEQPGCTGKIVDGYCDVCGLAPTRTTALPVAGHPKGVQPPASSMTVAAGASAVQTGTTRTRPSRRSRLGAGLVEIPSVPFRDPADAVLENPTVPESRRFCAGCDEPVGRSRDGTPGRAAGFCRKCGSSFSFEPKLQRGELVAGQYEVVGCLAHGGMGWVYLAKDRNVSDRWVVLKGLLNAGDSDATAAALAERRFLAEVEHDKIVKIYNFVEHESAGYIVMEYVGGQSLKQILAARRDANAGEPDPLPAAQAIAYMLEILPALEYLHDSGLLFCDFKLDNVIQTQHSLKLIDLGGVYRIAEPSSAVFGTVGYQAPEIAAAGPSVASDLFTVARTLAVLSIDFRGYQSTYRFTLPPQESVALFMRHDSLYRLLLRGTAPDPDDRFRSADEMADQLYGVLREVVAESEGRPVPGPSHLFTPPLRARVEGPDWRILPRPLVSSDDASAGYLAAIATSDPQTMITQLRAAPDRTVEVDLWLTAALIDSDEGDEAQQLLDAIEAKKLLDAIESEHPREWRVSWYRGLAEMARADADRAVPHFTRVYHELPGELAPKLALALACESAGALDDAARWYAVVSRTDSSVTSASFGLARCRLELGDHDGALSAYEQIPDSSSGYLDAQTARIRCLAEQPTIDAVIAAGEALQALPIEGEKRDQITAELFEAALGLTLDGQAAGNGGAMLLGRPTSERDLRLGLEHSYRALARRAGTRGERIRLVDQANRARPRTWT
ncbi:MAG TPA: tetratricopeptide repeat protein [Solirubrobacteraceae bacterium]|nr:tetratricopeptide repeat protein [Solirubrobacteraceae bacterium]